MTEIELSYREILLPDRSNSHLIATSNLQYTVLKFPDYVSVSLHFTLCQPNTTLTMASDKYLENKYPVVKRTDKTIMEYTERKVKGFKPLSSSAN